MSGGSEVRMVDVHELRKQYPGTTAVDGVNLQVEEGEMFGLIGPNGAGKSTVINMLCTITTPTSGRALVAGYDAVASRDLVRRNIGVVFQEQTVDLHLTASQNLRFHADLYGVPRRLAGKRAEHVLALVGLWDRRDEPLETFSGGMRRRLEVARGMLHSPRVFFVDEPSTGLDPEGRQAVWACLNELRRVENMTVFMTTHYLEEAEYCDRIAIMDQGSIVVVDTPDALKASVGSDRIFVGTPEPDTVCDFLWDSYAITALVRKGLVTFTVARGEEFIPRLLQELKSPITSIRMSRPTLDDVFMHFTGAPLEEPDSSALQGSG